VNGQEPEPLILKAHRMAEHRHWLIDDVYVGLRTTWRRTITPEDIANTIRLTGDQGGYHVDEAFARRAGFRTLIAPGMLQASLGTKLGGDLNFLAREMEFRFVKPVYAGDTLDVYAEVMEVEREKRFLRLQGGVVNQDREEVLTFKVAGYLPREEWGAPVKPARPLPE
jgi:3-hydroxybutyryl-CoA dehydratase